MELFKRTDYHKAILSIDFDGTICTHTYPECGTLIDGAKEVINKLYDEGFGIIIWTCRMDKPAESAKQFLLDNGVKYHKFNEHMDYLIEHYGNNTRKIFADIYIDDKNLGGLPSWDEIYKILKEKHKI